MVRGAFRRMHHDHFFTAVGAAQTLMKDVFCYEAPFGLAGSLADVLLLKGHFTHFIATRNLRIKKAAETGEWENYLPQSR